MPPRTRAKLSNCYTLLPLPSPQQSREQQWKRRDTGEGSERSANELRRLYLESGGESSTATSGDNAMVHNGGPTGSSLVELGHTKVVCHVVVAPTGDDNYAAESAQTITASVQYAPFAYPVDQLVASATSMVGSSAVSDTTGAPRMLRSAVIAKQAELSSKLTKVLTTVVPWPPQSSESAAPITLSVLQIRFIILQDDGGVLSACLTAASLALADACVEQYDVVVCGSVAGVRNEEMNMAFLADPDWSEMDAADATMTLAMLPNMKEVLVWEQTGCLSLSEANQAMEICRNGCRTMHHFLRQHWIDNYETKSSS